MRFDQQDYSGINSQMKYKNSHAVGIGLANSFWFQ